MEIHPFANFDFSFFLIGLGNADFTLMRALDGDDELLKVGEYGERKNPPAFFFCGGNF